MMVDADLKAAGLEPIGKGDAIVKERSLTGGGSATDVRDMLTEILAVTGIPSFKQTKYSRK